MYNLDSHLANDDTFVLDDDDTFTLSTQSSPQVLDSFHLSLSDASAVRSVTASSGASPPPKLAEPSPLSMSSGSASNSNKTPSPNGAQQQPSPNKKLAKSNRDWMNLSTFTIESDDPMSMRRSMRNSIVRIKSPSEEPFDKPSPPPPPETSPPMDDTNASFTLSGASDLVAAAAAASAEIDAAETKTPTPPQPPAAEDDEISDFTFSEDF